MPISVITEIQSLNGITQCSMLRRIIKSFAYKSLKNQEAIDDLTLAFDEALSYAPCGDKNYISVKVSNDSDNQISLEMAYKNPEFMNSKIKRKQEFERLVFTQLLDSIEYTVKAGISIIRLTKHL